MYSKIKYYSLKKDKIKMSYTARLLKVIFLKPIIYWNNCVIYVLTNVHGSVRGFFWSIHYKDWTYAVKIITTIKVNIIIKILFKKNHKICLISYKIQYWANPREIFFCSILTGCVRIRSESHLWDRFACSADRILL